MVGQAQKKKNNIKIKEVISINYILQLEYKKSETKKLSNYADKAIDKLLYFQYVMSPYKEQGGWIYKIKIKCFLQLY